MGQRQPKLQPADAAQAQRLLASGALAIDIRDAFDFNAEHIRDARSLPLSQQPGPIDSNGMAVLFYCQSGQTTAMRAAELARLAEAKSYYLDGGLDAWKEAGLPTTGGDQGALVGADLLRRLLKSIKPAD